MKKLLAVLALSIFAPLASAQLIIGGIAGGETQSGAQASSATQGATAATPGAGLAFTLSGASADGSASSVSTYDGSGGWATGNVTDTNTSGGSASGSLGTAAGGSAYGGTADAISQSTGGLVFGGLLVLP